MSGKKKSEHDRTVTRNRKARYAYEISERIEAGLVLTGSEVKSLRAGRVNIAEGHVRVKEGEAWLLSCHFSPYAQASYLNHEPERPRKLLLRSRQILQIKKATQEKGFTAIPLSIYFKGPWAKVEIGLAQGRKQHDKRQHIKERDLKRQLQRSFRS